jgi:hypothetical protein
MIYEFAKSYANQLASIQLLLLLLSAFINIIFAGAVAKDAGQLVKVGIRPVLVNGIIWAFATLIGGVFVAALYWFIHHSTLTRSHD